MYHQAWLPKATFRLSLDDDDDDALYHPFWDFLEYVPHEKAFRIC